MKLLLDTHAFLLFRGRHSAGKPREETVEWRQDCKW